MSKRLYTTFQAARLFGVTPDTVLNWIKSGKIPAGRTLGGHYRIRKETLDELLSRIASQDSVEEPTPTRNTFPYCWEFHSQHGKSIEACRSCLVHKTRAKYCYEMNPVPKKLGYIKMFCVTECEDCDYYKYVKKQLSNSRQDPC
ncbi:MAG: excisionase family DNA-binding protein [Candidatus Latescibacteria bacterium]|nr:excisionase family DNA-binding protein [Candidatus Latescibacterota bacterium]NIO56573.1 excisionase family DNA-binding protein [Candidatus Latescibacterota bacterium]